MAKKKNKKKEEQEQEVLQIINSNQTCYVQIHNKAVIGNNCDQKKKIVIGRNCDQEKNIGVKTLNRSEALGSTTFQTLKNRPINVFIQFIQSTDQCLIQRLIPPVITGDT